jgi:hypothetical protein
MLPGYQCFLDSVCYGKKSMVYMSVMVERVSVDIDFQEVPCLLEQFGPMEMLFSCCSGHRSITSVPIQSGI